MTVGIDPQVPPSGNGCAECEQSGGWWLHLRRCAQCGHVGCCDSSPAQHASGHATSTGHRYVQSFEPGEEWYWDYAEATMLGGPGLTPPSSRPDGQASPGPADRLPDDWMRHLNR